MDLATIIGVLTAISLLLGILVIIYKFTKIMINLIGRLIARETKQDRQIKDLYNIIEVLREKVKQLEGYSAKKKVQGSQNIEPFYPDSSLETLQNSADQSFKEIKTDFTNL